MKKIVAIGIMVCMALNLLAFAGAEEMLYEAEAAVMGGGNAVAADALASGGKAVGRFESSADTITFTVEVPADGVYDLVLCSKGIGGGKTNNVVVDGAELGQFQCPGTDYYEDTVRGALLAKGTHTITITSSWGWIYLDYLKIFPSAAIPEDVYQNQPELINKNATPETRQLYAYLCECYGKVTLSGQVCDRGTAGAELKAIYQLTGKYPAILGLDMMEYTPSRTERGARSAAVEEAIRYHEMGGIITFCWHWGAPATYILDGNDANGNPRWWGGFYTENTTFDIAAVMNGSDPEGKQLLDRDIAEIARQLKRLEEAGVPVLWRPLHEASGGWFWWGAKGPEACKQLWIYLYEELTYTYGCNNLIWVWNGQNADWYPGDEYVDIIGEDIYAAKHNYGAQNSKFSEALDYTPQNKIVALTENGVVPDIDLMLQTNARWAWFCTWSGDFVQKYGVYSPEYTEPEILQKAYESEYVITLDELPTYKKK